jgi:hypothetical protein
MTRGVETSTVLLSDNSIETLSSSPVGELIISEVTSDVVSMAQYDILGFQFRRSGASGSDNYSQDMNFLGAELSYETLKDQ